MAKPRSSRRMKGRAGLERNFFQTSASRLKCGKAQTDSKQAPEPDFSSHKEEGDILFGMWNMFLHVVQGALCDSFLENKIFQLVAVAVVFDSSSDFTEAIQKDFVISTVLFIIPWKTKNALIHRKTL